MLVNNVLGKEKKGSNLLRQL